MREVVNSIVRFASARLVMLIISGYCLTVMIACSSRLAVLNNGYEQVTDPVQASIVADTAHISKAVLQNNHLRIDYLLEGEPRQAIARLPPLPGEPANEPTSDPAEQLPVAVLQDASVKHSQPRHPSYTTITVRDHQAWQDLLYSALSGLVPESPGSGACVDILQQQELFVYRDDIGATVSVPLVFKPGDVAVTTAYSFSNFLAVMAAQAATETANDQMLLFETGDDSPTGYPFVFVDIGNDRIIFLQHIPRDMTETGYLPISMTLEMFARTVSDHLFAAVNQPVSSVTRLLTMVSLSTLDIMRPTPLVLTEGNPIPPLNDITGMDIEAWEERLDLITGTSQSSGRLDFLVDGISFFPALIDQISVAQHSVDMRVYIFDNDDYATSIADLLKRRSSEIDIRVLVDGLGTLGAGMAQASSSTPPGQISTSSIMRYLKRDSNVQVRAVSNVWLTGDHTKTIIVDNRVAFLGGMNIGREYRYDWHDLMIEIEGPVVSEIIRDFDRAWASSGFMGDIQRLGQIRVDSDTEVVTEGYPIRLLYTRPGDSQILRAQIDATRRAQQRIYLQNPYITSDAMLYELVKARRRGVDVRVIIPYQNDNGIIARSNVVVANAMLKHGIRVYIYPGMSHLKAAIYDGWACLGSANMDNLSLRTNREMNLATSHAPAVDALREQVFDIDMQQSLELTEPLPANWSDYLAELLADSL